MLPLLTTPLRFGIHVQRGDAFDLAVLAASLLIGAGYDAYAAIGNAPAHLAGNDLSCARCPALRGGERPDPEPPEEAPAGYGQSDGVHAWVVVLPTAREVRCCNCHSTMHLPGLAAPGRGVVRPPCRSWLAAHPAIQNVVINKTCVVNSACPGAAVWFGACVGAFCWMCHADRQSCCCVPPRQVSEVFGPGAHRRLCWCVPLCQVSEVLWSWSPQMAMLVCAPMPGQRGAGPGGHRRLCCCVPLCQVSEVLVLEPTDGCTGVCRPARSARCWSWSPQMAVLVCVAPPDQPGAGPGAHRWLCWCVSPRQVSKVLVLEPTDGCVPLCQVSEVLVLEPASGLRASAAAARHTRLEALWNHRGFWACLQLAEQRATANAGGGGALARLAFDLGDSAKWEALFLAPPPAQVTAFGCLGCTPPPRLRVMHCIRGVMNQSHYHGNGCSS